MVDCGDEENKKKMELKLSKMREQLTRLIGKSAFAKYEREQEVLCKAHKLPFLEAPPLSSAREVVGGRFKDFGLERCFALFCLLLLLFIIIFTLIIFIAFAHNVTAAGCQRQPCFIWS